MCIQYTLWNLSNYRLAFGLKLAPEWFQKISEKYFADIPGVTVYIDDIIIATTNEKDHDQILEMIVKRAIKNGVKFNKSKIQFKQKSVKYLGQIFDENGMHCDPDKINAIKQLKNPQNRKELQSILGMINYLRGYIPNLSEKTEPLRALLRKDILFQWTELHTKTLDKLKIIMSKAPVLAPFVSELEATIQTDASKDGIGSVLLQSGRPVAYSSRSLTDTEKEYAQIEKEMLAIVHAIKKFHLYIYGRRFTVMTDHKPLLAIMQKPISKIYNHRLQRLKLKIIKYDFQIRHAPGKEMHIADLLSRNYLDVAEPEDVTNEEMVHTITKQITITDTRKEQFQIAVNQDKELRKILKYCLTDWPKSKKKLNADLYSYWDLKEDIHTAENLLFYKERIIVPKILRSDMLKLLHESHHGIVKTKLLANNTFYWPYMNKDIENLVNNCNICEKYRSKNPNNILKPHEIPKLPFKKIAADILEYGGENYLVIMDYYSKWLEVKQMKGKTSNNVIATLKPIFACHGIPSMLIADNMPFNSYECRKFAKEWAFKIITTSPHLSRSNGQAESGVKIAKMIL